VVTRSILRPYIFIRAFFNAQKRKYILEERKMTLYEELVARGLIAQVTNEEEISRLINEGKATFYIGFDPTADSLHVGHFMALCLMKRLQMGGNKPIALIGGGTAMIGDPSGRTDMRQMMTKETIQHNCDCFKKQMSRFIDFSEGKALMVNNADWLLDLNYIEVLRDVPRFLFNQQQMKILFLYPDIGRCLICLELFGTIYEDHTMLPPHLELM
jgi:tyrosyl-tRNA synthetase